MSRIIRDIVACLGAAILVVIGIDSGIMSYAGAFSSASAAPRPTAITAVAQDVIVKPVSHFRLDTSRAVIKPEIYSVRPGDNLTSISARLYGRSDTWTVIYWANHKSVKYPNLIYTGQQLSIPALPARIPAAPAIMSPPVLTSSVTHTSSSTGDSDSDSIAGDSAPQRLVSPPKLPPAHGTGGSSGCSDPSGHLTQAQIGMLWVCAGGPAWAEGAAERVSYCESGWYTYAHNPSGADGLWQILGQVVGGYIYDAHINALNAVSKFTASGDRWSQWVCQP